MKDNKTYCVVHRKDGDIVTNVRLDEYYSIKFTFAYSSISSTYYGMMVECFINTMRAFIKDYPDFFDDVSFGTQELHKWLKSHGFTEVEPDMIDMAIAKIHDKE
jgi:hypothetical protein